ncbi:formyl transferase [Marinobacter qingdaonensis]|jgi:methionyl-tRNA formyltransferase|uniref:phosphoribosylglycinamide formyltransferase 1 n=1 Tax=Marinobacter qingdaonensis TaxID=3108486 RepID=A0ABU5P1A4_9GAMM|nr:formyl transferase [Marinobacter sp. ASW11-75]MEA1081861.1 formyl transferase [Marinobacter sp. ASW11-75]
MRVVVVVSQDKSDIFFANQLMRSLPVVGVVVENQVPRRDRASLLSKSLKYLSQPGVFVQKTLEVVDRTLIEPRQVYNRPENALDFGEEGRTLRPNARIPVLYTKGVNAINAPENRAWIRGRQPDLIAVCGASILKPELLSVPRHGVLNLHGGLSQFYRGLFTTDWAIHNREPECVGATVHFVSEGVDDGDVVYQGRPVVSAGDNPNSLYAKVVRLGVEMMVRAVQDIEAGACNAHRLDRKGRLYLNHMFSTGAKRATWHQLESGVIEDYLGSKAERDARVLEAMINPFPESLNTSRRLSAAH